MIKIYLTKKIDGQELPVTDFKIGLNVGQRGKDAVVPEGTVIDPYYVHTDNNYTDAAVLEVAKIAGKQDTTADLLETESKTVVGAINEVNSIAKQASNGRVFATVTTIDAWLAIPENVAKLKIGDAFYIIELDVPDYWWDGTQKQELETQKVDLSQYYTSDQIDTLLGNYYTSSEIDTILSGYALSGHNHEIGSLTNVDLTETTPLATDSVLIEQTSTGKVKKSLFSTIVTFLGNTFAKSSGNTNISSDKFTDNKGNNPFVSQNGGTMYHTTKWFTTTQSITIAADGLSATAAGAQFTAGTSQLAAKLIVDGVERIITTPNPTTTVVYVTEAFPVAMRGQTYTSSQWGVYGREYVNRAFFTTTGIQINYENYFYAGISGDSGGFVFINSNGVNLSPSRSLLWAAIEGSNSNNRTKDTGLSRNSAGVLEINNGTAGTFRDLNLRNLNYTGTLTNTSDERLKENFSTVNDGLEKVLKLAECIRHYNYIDQNNYAKGLQTNFIAQLLQDAGFDGHVKEREPRNSEEGVLFGWEYEMQPVLKEDGEPELNEDETIKIQEVVTKRGDMVLTVESTSLPIYLFPAISELNDRIKSIEERLNKAGL